MVLLLLRLPSNGSDAVPASLSKWKSGRRIEVVLTSNEKVIGRLGAVEPDRFILKSDHPGGADREFRFPEVRSVTTKMTVGKKWAIAGAVYGVLTVMSLILGK